MHKLQRDPYRIHPLPPLLEQGIDDLVERVKFVPEQGKIFLDEKRMFLLHAASFGAMRRELIENLGTEVARGLLTRMGHLAGSRDAELAKELRKGEEINDIFLIGPQLHALEGVVLTERIKFEVDAAHGHFYGEFIWKNSIECEAHIADYEFSPESVCWMQVGYACGYSSAFMGSPILFREIECKGMGHEHCRVIGRPASEWDNPAGELRFFSAQPFANREVANLAPHRGSSNKSPSPISRFDQRKLIGVSSEFNATCHMINRVAKTSTPVLFLGESGVGKEMFAKILHEESDRSKKPLIAVNCAAIPETLIEADLFGVEKGAFTGAVASKPGRFERADGGTLLLDEVGCLSLAAQAKLLRVLQEGQVERVGDNTARSINVRIVAATNENIAELVKSGKFREDLFFRLNIFPINIPPLRERRDDIPILIDYFIKRYSTLHKRNIAGISEEALNSLLKYSWPGNVRELENAIERAILLASTNGAIEISNLPHSVTIPNTPSPHLTPLHPPIIQSTIHQAEYEIIKKTIEENRGNLTAAAQKLGITRAQLSYRAKKLGLKNICRSRS